MLIAFKTYGQAENPPPGIPSDWPSIQLHIEPKDKEAYEKTGHRVMAQEEFVEYLKEKQQAFDLWFENHGSLSHPKRLRVYDLVKDEFRFYHPSKIDFRRHLKPYTNLQKTVEMMLNGRPKRAEYWHNEVKICEIKFEFATDPFNFMLRRTELLGYVNQSNEIDVYYPIHDQFYDPQDTHHARERIRERVEARTIILDEIKAKVEAFLYQYLTAQGKSYIEVLTIGGRFWAHYASSVSAWVNTGTTEFKDEILADVEFGFLDFIIPQSLTSAPEDLPIRDYIAWRITY